MKLYLKLSIILLLFVNYAHGKQESVQSEEFKKFLNGLILPYVGFKKDDGFTLTNAVSFAVSRGIENDPFSKDGERRGFAKFVTDKNKHIKNCYTLPDGAEEIRIVFEARDISMHKFLIEIARQSKLDLYATSDGLVFSRPNEKSRKALLNKKLIIWFAIYKVKPIEMLHKAQ